MRLIYLPCSNGSCDISSLLEIIKKCLITNFVFSHKEIQKKIEINNPESEKNLFKKAVRTISRKTAHGELGELLLFTLLDVYLGAPKILSKISMKTSRRMPVYGADAVHAQFVDGNLRLYLGESKLHKTFTSAASDAVKSIATARANYEQEFDLIETHINFPEINEHLEKKLISALNPFEDAFDHSAMLYSPCFIGFAEPKCFLEEEAYLDNYKNIATKYIDNYYSKLKNIKITHDKSTLLLIPFSSITVLVKEFISYMGIQK